MKRNAVCAFALLLAGSTAAIAGPLHEQVLHTQVRVRTDKAGGSGTVIYAEKNGNYYSTYVITCHHVIDGALTLETKWDSLLQRDRKQEQRQPVTVEMFQWSAVPHGRAPLTAGTRADIVAYSAKHDMALLHLELATRPPVAKILPSGRITSVEVGSPVVAVGCALLHDPILTSGIVTHMGDILDGVDYWMSNAQIIFGNSGGGMFLKDDAYYFIGIPSAGDVVYGSPITHLGYFSPITRVFDFLAEQMYDFLIPGSAKTEAQCAAEREAKRALEEKKLRVE